MITVNSNQDCFLLAGGPSLKGFDFKRLDGKFTIGVNKIFKIFHPNIIYCMDRKFYNYLHLPAERKLTEDANILNEWLTSPAIKAFLSPSTSPKKNERFFKESFIEVIPRISNKCISFDINEGIYPGTNSGFGALSLAIALGFKKIYLLGYDLKINGKDTHFHKGYPNQSIDTQQRHLNNFKRTFEFFAPKIKEAGVTVINLTPDSALTCFDKMNIEEVLG